MNSDNFLIFYGIKGVEILIVVLIVSAIVALIEKIFSVDQTPRHILKARELMGSGAVGDPVHTGRNVSPIA